MTPSSSGIAGRLHGWSIGCTAHRTAGSIAKPVRSCGSMSCSAQYGQVAAGGAHERRPVDEAPEVGAHDARIGEQALHVAGAEPGLALRVEAGERLRVDGPLSQDRGPRQPRLGGRPRASATRTGAGRRARAHPTRRQAGDGEQQRAADQLVHAPVNCRHAQSVVRCTSVQFFEGGRARVSPGMPGWPGKAAYGELRMPRRGGVASAFVLQDPKEVDMASSDQRTTLPGKLAEPPLGPSRRKSVAQRRRTRPRTSFKRT